MQEKVYVMATSFVSNYCPLMIQDLFRPHALCSQDKLQILPMILKMSNDELYPLACQSELKYPWASTNLLENIFFFFFLQASNKCEYLRTRSVRFFPMSVLIVARRHIASNFCLDATQRLSEDDQRNKRQTNMQSNRLPVHVRNVKSSAISLKFCWF